MLNGIVVTNAIVLLDRVKQNEQKGMEKREALIEAGVTRVRPILMTAIATVGALLPLALSTEAGLVSRALAVVVIGGLVSSTLLTLLIVPVIYSFMGSRPEKVKQKVLVPVKQL
ncbi:Swarming motility protein SwrC [compost metagenome]